MLEQVGIPVLRYYILNIQGVSPDLSVHVSPEEKRPASSIASTDSCEFDDSIQRVHYSRKLSDTSLYIVKALDQQRQQVQPQ